MKPSFRRVLAAVTAVLLLPVSGQTAWTASGEETDTPSASSAGRDYAAYLQRYEGAPRPMESIAVTGESFLPGESSGTETGGTGVRTREDSLAVWKVVVPAAGLYRLEVTYFPDEGKAADITREVEVNGEVPFEDAGAVVFKRVWKDGAAIKPAADGNEYRPPQIEAPVWITAAVDDSMGYFAEPFQFYFQEGMNTVGLRAVGEPMTVKGLRLYNEEPLPSYEEKRSEYTRLGYKPAAGGTVKIQGENASRKSDATLYPLADRTSPLTEDTDIAKTRLNVIGGLNWSYPGQWITWDIQVPQSGLYTLSFRCKQNFSEDIACARALYIDGAIPFEEARCLRFPFSYDWQMESAGGDEPWLFYLEAGKTHTITLKNVLGDVGDILRETQNSIQVLNGLYQKINRIVGSFPDANRDYGIEKQLPDCLTVFSEQSERLREVAGRLSRQAGAKGGNYAIFQKVFVQLDSFVRDPSSIPVRLDSFSTNISTLAGFIQEAAGQPLLIDYLLAGEPGGALPRAKETFWEKAVYEARMFAASFFSDYNSIGLRGEESRQVGLWVTTGRDQAQVIKSLADNLFTPSTGVGMDIRLVSADVLLPAVASGMGPDVAIGQERSMPVNYGLRSALVDLTQFPDLPEILGRFRESAHAPYWVEKSLYGLPDTENFLMLFYRTDVLADLGLQPPETWDDLRRMLFDLHQNFLDVGFPNISNVVVGAGESQIDLYLMLLFQNGGRFYNDALSATLLEEEGVEAFETWAEFYTRYKITTEMNHITRFRSGEAPLVLQPVTFYNLLSVSAPEIRGLWEMAPIIGTRKEDGTMDRSEGSTGTASVIFANTGDKEAAWEFLKWWTSADAQTGYSREMETLQGASARVPTANLEAFSRLAWPTKASRVIAEQREAIQPYPEAPGSYVVNRYLSTAIRTAANTGGDAKEILLDWNKKINNEIHIRREEFHLGD